MILDYHYPVKHMSEGVLQLAECVLVYFATLTYGHTHSTLDTINVVNGKLGIILILTVHCNRKYSLSFTSSYHFH